ncbi:MAG: hypothetical protein GF419_13540 [Ignavibacteriales bacterium]|jgi:hypothetical protein|nr:hypothetical protein [Ignavibacteriales bacterium]
MKIKEKEFDAIVDQLRSIADQLGATVRFEKGDFKGGYCILKSNKVIVINKLANSQRRAVILATALRELGVEDVYLPPKLREVIQEMGDAT